jgi:ABC-2 type transport system ATP-binding protein
MSKNVIEVKNLTKKYVSVKKKTGFSGQLKNLFSPEKKTIEAVKSINFEIARGEMVGFLGPNGAGKTTTLKMLSGIIAPTSGKMRVLGFDPWEKKNAYKKRFSLVMGQKNQLWWDLPVIESFSLNRSIYDVPRKIFDETLEELVEMLDIKKVLNFQVRNLSLGERMKCELAAALLHQPEVMFLDEPTIGLDIVAQKNIREFLKEYNAKKKVTVLLTSHYMKDIENLCERIIIINQKIFFDGQISELIEKYADRKIITIVTDKKVALEDAKELGVVRKFDPYEIQYEIPRDKIREKMKEIVSSNLPIDDILVDEIGVEKIIRRIFEKLK